MEYVAFSFVIGVDTTKGIHGFSCEVFFNLEVQFTINPIVHVRLTPSLHKRFNTIHPRHFQIKISLGIIGMYGKAQKFQKSNDQLSIDCYDFLHKSPSISCK